MDVEDKNSNFSLLTYNDEQKQLELNGYPLQRGEKIEILLMGHWIPGSVQLDKSGWYLLTYDYIGIRLNAGLKARRPRYILTFSSSPEKSPNISS